MPFAHLGQLRVRLLAAAVFLLLARPLLNAQQPTASSALLAQFRDTAVFWRQLEVAQHLAALHDPGVLPALEPYLNDDDRHLRANAAYVFAALDDPRGLVTLTDILADRTSARRKAQGIPGGNWSTRAQIRADRYYAVNVLGVLESPRALPVLIPLLHDPALNYEVPWALAEIGDPAAIGPLTQALSDPSSDVRVAAIEALVHLHAREALPQIRQLAGDTAPVHSGKPRTVADAARVAITGLQ